MATEPATYRKDLIHPAGHGYGRNVGTQADPIWIGERAEPASTVIIHATHGKPGTSSIDEALYLRNSADVGAHYLIGRGAHDGRLFSILPENLIAWHSGDTEPDRFQNATSIGIEIHAATSEAITPAQRRTLAWLLVSIAMRRPITAADIRSHRSVAVPPGRKSDPAMWPDVELNAWVSGVLVAPRPLELPDVPTPAPLPFPPYTEDSPILAAPPGDEETFVSALLERAVGGNYDAVAVAEIARGYWAVSTAAGVDAWLAAGQCMHETGWLTSFWSARPQRNPAGLGVTGEWRDGLPTNPAPGPDWAYNSQRRRWERGLSFPTWVKHAIPAHVGRLLAYAVLPAYQTPEQAALVQYALSVRTLPTAYYGTAPTLKGLDRKWAAGNQYASAIAKAANRLRGIV